MAGIEYPRNGTHDGNPSFGYFGYCLNKNTKQRLADDGQVSQPGTAKPDPGRRRGQSHCRLARFTPRMSYLPLDEGAIDDTVPLAL